MFVWLGDFAYVSRTKRVDFLTPLQNPSQLPQVLPSLSFELIVQVRHKVKKLYDNFVCNSKSLKARLCKLKVRDSDGDQFQSLPWKDYLAGGFEILPWEKIEMRMNETWSNPHYQDLLSKTQVVGIWDDNDFGVNDGQFDNPIKHEIKDVYLKYIYGPENRPLW
mmetsp:Transcript_9262/g.15575  ORF Transcript_9262/g.15575 Transcript_9262/m.15575 type:complete len:164 (+) Transcript_9262:192-683(+)